MSFHGLALNVCNDLSWYEHIVPCGLKDKEMTSMDRLLNRHSKREREGGREGERERGEGREGEREREGGREGEIMMSLSVIVGVEDVSPILIKHLMNQFNLLLK